MMMNEKLIALIAGCVLLLLGVAMGGVLKRLTCFLGKKLHPVVPRWLAILARGFQGPVILLVRYGLIALAVWVLPLPVDKQVLLMWLVPLSKAVLVALVCWGLWRTSPVCQLLLRSVEDTIDVNSGKTIGRFFENIYKAVVALFAALSVLDLLGLPVGSLIAGAGVAGLAVSLAAQSTLSNLIAGITLVLEKPFDIGDYVTLGAVEGTVEDVSFRSTRLRTPDNVLITVENAKVCAEYIHNNTNRTSRLWTFDMNLGYETTPDKLAEVVAAMEEILRGDEEVKADTVQVIVERLDAAGVVVNVRCYVTTTVFARYRALKNRLNCALMEAVHRCGCRFAPPASRVYVEGTMDGE